LPALFRRVGDERINDTCGTNTLRPSANSAFNFDVNHLNAESAETQRTAEKKKCAHCSSPTQSRRCPQRHLTPDATTCSNCQRKTLPRKQNSMHLQCSAAEGRVVVHISAPCAIPRAARKLEFASGRTLGRLRRTFSLVGAVVASCFI